MSFLVANVPPHKCYVRKEYLYKTQEEREQQAQENQPTKENDPYPFIFRVEPGDEGSC